MYEKHFSFKYKPFELVPNPDLLFLSSTHKKAITCLDYGLKEKIGFILLTGEIGSGKTTIIRNFIKNLNGSVKLSRIHNTKISSEQLISMVNEDFGLEIEGKNKIRLLSELNVFLIEQYSRNYQPILLIDEAQNLSPDLLEEIRLLSNLETDNAKLLQIILVGQPELKKLLMLPELMQLRQRININYHIAPLTIDETAQYIKHRLTVAGNPEAIKVQEDMLPLVYQFSKGIPRLINILCDFALLTAFVAGKEEVTVDIVREVVKDLKSNDSWNEGDTSSSQEVRKNERTDFSKTVGDVSLRLFKLEEIVTSCIQEIFSLKEKMVQLDGNMSNLSAAQNENRINELSERISMLDMMSADINPEKKNKPPQTEKQQSKVLHKLSEQIGILTDTISRLNDKIKNQ
jgi:putative secretion ATPase (PEP-CTERM system associated)